MRYSGIITLLVLCLTLLLLTGCMTNTVTPEIDMGNSNNPNSNNYQNPSTDPVEEPATEEPVEGNQTGNNPSSNNSQGSSTGSVEDPVIEDTEEPAEEPGTIYPQKWATGDGTAENPWANGCIKSAYDNAPEGGTIYLRAGYYQLTGVCAIYKPINIIGEGMGKTFIVTDNISGIHIEANYVTLQGFTIDADAQDAEWPGIQYEGDYLVFKDIEVKNAGNYGIVGADSDYGLFRNIYLHDNGNEGFHPAGSAAGKGIYNTYQHIYSYDNAGMGFATGGSAEDPELPRHNVYDNIHTWGNTSGCGIAITGITACVLSNSSSSGDQMGLYFSGVTDFVVSNCSVELSQVDGVIIDECENLYFTNVTSKNNNTANSGTQSGFWLWDCDNVTFDSCQSYDDRETPLQDYGIMLEGTTNYVELMGCELMPNKISAIYNGSGAVIVEKAVNAEAMLLKL